MRPGDTESHRHPPQPARTPRCSRTPPGRSGSPRCTAGRLTTTTPTIGAAPIAAAAPLRRMASAGRWLASIGAPPGGVSQSVGGWRRSAHRRVASASRSVAGAGRRIAGWHRSVVASTPRRAAPLVAADGRRPQRPLLRRAVPPPGHLAGCTPVGLTTATPTIAPRFGRNPRDLGQFPFTRNGNCPRSAGSHQPDRAIRFRRSAIRFQRPAMCLRRAPTGIAASASGEHPAPRLPPHPAPHPLPVGI
ncbi:hypothetical protein PSN13_00550 [Micromonospora saelicesensis]|uniref:Uncharacterized protein n=1 Tax=Micromonospora saelicesensis TaxID=285676 RepID=A0A328NU00_9ACTN|nr:hypothetical protein PSN13_00550 [Micromonospora saelicesensis]